MARYTRPVLMPAAPGDEVEITWITCRFCGYETTVATAKDVQHVEPRTTTSVVICCDPVARLFYADVEPKNREQARP